MTLLYERFRIKKMPQSIVSILRFVFLTWAASLCIVCLLPLNVEAASHKEKTRILIPIKPMAPAVISNGKNLSGFVLRSYESALKPKGHFQKPSAAFIAKLKATAICTFSARGQSGNWASSQVIGSAVLSPEQTLVTFSSKNYSEKKYELNIERNAFILVKNLKTNRDVIKVTPGSDRITIHELDSNRDTKVLAEIANGSDLSILTYAEGQAIDCQSLANFFVRRVLAKTEPRTQTRGFRLLNPGLMNWLELRELARISQLDPRDLKKFLKRVEDKQFDLNL